MKINPYDVVQTSYLSLDKTIKNGLFVVLSVDKTNAVCAKLTSQHDSKYLDFSVELLVRTNPFLNADSYIQLNKLHTFSVEALSYLGTVAPVIRPQIKVVFNRFAYAVVQDLNSRAKFNYRSPNVNKRFPL